MNDMKLMSLLLLALLSPAVAQAGGPSKEQIEIDFLKDSILFNAYVLSPYSEDDENFKISSGIKKPKSKEERAISIRALQRDCGDLFNRIEPLREKKHYKVCLEHGWVMNSKASGI